ncbi:MAG: hypothetical protein LBI03_11175 [Clostridiales bacterium]|jgi:hypothetical protein|nr:hypothetical protein [Clostridiales bacterium]
MPKLNIKYSMNLGTLYDSINYINYKFNSDVIDQVIQGYEISRNEYLEYYNKTDINIDGDTEPFFHIFNANSFLTAYFFENISSFTEENLDEFLENIDTSRLKQQYIQFYNKEGRYESSRSKEKTAFLNNFEEQCKKLYGQMNATEKRIRELHDVNILGKLFDEVVQSDVLSKISVQNNIDRDIIRKSFVSFSYMAPFSIKTTLDKGSNYLILGVNYKQYMDHFYPESYDYLDINRIGKIFSHPIKTSIIKLLRKHGPLSVAQIVRLIKMPATTVYRIVAIMFDEKVLVYEERTDREIYYDLNPRYFDAAERVIKEFIKDLL